MSEDKTALHRRIREALGEEINPLYVETLLAMSTVELLGWLQRSFADDVNVVAETIGLSGLEGKEGAYGLGLRILKSHLALKQFILQELFARHSSIDVEEPQLAAKTQ